MLKRAGPLALLLATLGTSQLGGEPDTSVPLAHHLNDIDSVICDSNQVVFLSKDGAIVHSKRGGLWSFDLPRKYLGTSRISSQYFDGLDNPLSSWLNKHMPIRSAYPAGLGAVERDSTLMILAMAGGDGPWHMNCLVDTLQRKVFCYPLDKTKAFAFDDETLWLGRFDGLAKVARLDGQRSEFVVLPMITEDSSVLVDSLHLWIAADGVGIQRINIETRELTFWRAEDILGDLHERWQLHNPTYVAPRGKVVFTNFAPTPDKVYIACHHVGGGNNLIRRSSYLLEFQRSTEEWDSAWLQADGGVRCEGISIIEIHRQFLIFGGTHQDAWEGAGHEEFGGVFYYTVGKSLPQIGWSVINESAVGIGHLVTNMQDTADGELIIETFAPVPDYSRKRTYRLDREYRVTVVSDSVGDAFQEEYRMRKRLGNPRGQVALPDSLHLLPVVPGVWPLREGQVDVTTY
jgi:hypothetical protein